MLSIYRDPAELLLLKQASEINIVDIYRKGRRWSKCLLINRDRNNHVCFFILPSKKLSSVLSLLTILTHGSIS